MKASRYFITPLILLALLVAGAHVTLEHGGKRFGAHIEEAVHGGHHHDEEPAPDRNDHHPHDLGAVTVAHFTKASEKQVIAPQGGAIYKHLLAELTALLRMANAGTGHSTIGDSPPDERASGWLFVVRTALPVRGPSLV